MLLLFWHIVRYTDQKKQTNKIKQSAKTNPREHKHDEWFIRDFLHHVNNNILQNVIIIIIFIPNKFC